MKEDLKKNNCGFTLLNNDKNLTGFSLIEVLVSLLIVMVLMLGIYSLIQFSLKITASNKYYVEAINIANQKMERIRNLPYNSVGVMTGIPTGVIPQYETINRDGVFIVHNFVSFYDDPYDGTEEAGTDLFGGDYKIATVQVNWKSNIGSSSLTIFSKIIPKTEEMLTDGGLLKIVAVDSNGNPVPNANIHIENHATSPQINFDAITNSSGKISFPGAPATYESYEVTVTKAGYSTEKTYARTVQNPNPTKPHLSVTDGLKTEESFSIDHLSTLQIQAAILTSPENQKVNTDTGGENQLNPAITIDNAGNKYVVWQDYRSASAAKIYAQKYNASNHNVWPSDVVISPANNQVLPETAIDNFGNLYVAWNDNSNGNQDAFLDKRASSNGQSLWAGMKVNTLADPKDQTNTKIALTNTATSANVFIVWQDDRNNDLDIFLQGYNENHQTLLSPEIRINNNPINDGTDQYNASITTNSQNQLLIVWTDERNGNQDIYAQKYSATGTKLWLTDIKINTDSSATKQYSPVVARDSSNNIYIAWTDERNGNPDIYAQKYSQNGVKIWTDDLKINTDSGSTKQYSPSIALDSSNNIYIAWTDERNGNPDIYAQKYDSDGTKLWNTDQRINVNLGNSTQATPSLAINPFTEKPVVTWQDNRNGDYDIYLVEFDDPVSIQHLAVIVPLKIIGTKKIGENPIIYKVNMTVNTENTGIITMPIEWDVPGYNISLNTASTSRTLMMSDPDQPINILAGETKNVILYLK